MIRGKMLFRCSKCKKIFVAPDMEYCASILSTPMPCPRCGSIRTMPLYAYLNPFNISIYKKIWETMEENMTEQERNEEKT